MRISVDAHAIGCRLTGNEVYIRNLLKQFARLDEDSELIAYISKEGVKADLPARIRTRGVSQNPYKRLGLDLPQHLLRDRPDLLHVQYTGPLFSAAPLVVSVHDVSFLEYPQYFTRFRSLQLRLTVQQTVQRAARVLTPSEYSRRAILKHYRIPEDKVVVVPNAVAGQFRPIEREVARAAIQRKFGIRRPFVLTVGDLQPRKNHVGLLHAFEDVLQAEPKLPHDLVFVGKETWYSRELHRAVDRSGVQDRVHFAGFVEDSDLVKFYGACDLFAFPSFYEGFGLPILEAMACGRAVVCSRTTAMPEVANAAGILFDPGSKEEIARAMLDVLLNCELRARLERLGLHRAAGFSWEKSAAQTLDVYYDVAGRRPRRVAALAARVS
ncbi:MAG TPA: glycosyltransferase family 1 protein [Bryobacteraceae bacterium]|jgi:glycosyltransferase involved in cell wall biosynthesis|nr:glycosyltransferase family 1 protein [Bryobacteraceae bacterium]